MGDTPETALHLYFNDVEVERSKIILESGLSYGSVVNIVIVPQETINSTSLHVIACFSEKECDVEKESITSLPQLDALCNVMVCSEFDHRWHLVSMLQQHSFISHHLFFVMWRVFFPAPMFL